MPPVPRRESLNDVDLSPLPLDRAVQLVYVAVLEHIGQHLQHAARQPGAARCCDAPPPCITPYGMFPIILFASSTEKPRSVSLRTLPSDPVFRSAVVTASSVPSRMSTMS